MFIRKIKSRNSICFQIGEKRAGRFVVIDHVGCATTPPKIEALRLKALQRLQEEQHRYQLNLFPSASLNFPTAKVSDWQITGYHQVFGNVYDRIGFPPTLLRDLVIARIAHPKSKAATIRYLENYLGIPLKKDTVYRFLDTLNKRSLTQVAYDFVRRHHPHGISICFYDVTTLYFETPREDEFKQKGFSKDHRTDMPQILIGLFVDSHGYPFDLDWFEGKTFEEHTFSQAVNSIQNRYSFPQLTVVADAGMLSQNNLTYLEENNIYYIVGARLKNLSPFLTQRMLSHPFQRQEEFQTFCNRQRFIVDYSQSRAKQDRKNRERMLIKLEKKLKAHQTIIKKSKYLKLEGKQKVVGIDEDQIIYDQKFDGLKGYYTNLEDKIAVTQIIDQYHQLWRVEKAFRMSKHDLQERPIYHSQPARIKAHLLLCFVSLLVMKETEIQLQKINCTIEKAIELLGKVGQGKVRVNNVTLAAESEVDELTQSILDLFAGH
ncbi:MAG: IS1634 family transposase [Elusimicrobia bacterium]|nr:IS1634 family transposase [Elusimicrobiota bacterium]